MAFIAREARSHAHCVFATVAEATIVRRDPFRWFHWPPIRIDESGNAGCDGSFNALPSLLRFLQLEVSVGPDPLDPHLGVAGRPRPDARPCFDLLCGNSDSWVSRVVCKPSLAEGPPYDRGGTGARRHQPGCSCYVGLGNVDARGGHADSCASIALGGLDSCYCHSPRFGVLST